jgi:hypothetical protein
VIGKSEMCFYQVLCILSGIFWIIDCCFKPIVYNKSTEIVIHF